MIVPRRLSNRSEPRIVASVEGRIVPIQNAKIPVADWAFRFGWGLFETIRVHRGKALFLDLHIERMIAGSNRLAIEMGGKDWWWRAIQRLITSSGVTEGAMNLFVTKGAEPDFRPGRIIILRPSRRAHREQGQVWVAPWRIDPLNPMVGCKTLAYFPNVFESEVAESHGCDDVIVLNTRGRVADGARASVFTVEEHGLRTPSFKDGALAGVVRQIIIDCARSLGVQTREGGLTRASLIGSEGVFLTSSLRGLRMARRVGDKPLRVTPRARRLFDLLQTAYLNAIKQDLRNSPA